MRNDLHKRLSRDVVATQNPEYLVFPTKGLALHSAQGRSLIHFRLLRHIIAVFEDLVRPLPGQETLHVESVPIPLRNTGIRLFLDRTAEVRLLFSLIHVSRP